MKAVYGRIVGTEDVVGFFTKELEEVSGIMKFYTTTEQEGLSIHLCNLIFEKLSAFYVTKTIEKQKKTFDLLTQKLDSINTEMKKAEYLLANFRDTHAGLYTRKDQMQELQYQRDVKILNEMYAVSIKNFEIADFSLKNKTPFIQLIDEPFAPLRPNKRSLVKNIILGGILGGFCLLYTSPSPRDLSTSRMPSSA